MSLDSTTRADLPTGTTGRTIVVLEPRARGEGEGLLRDVTGIRVQRVGDAPPGSVPGEDAYLDQLGIAILAADPDQVSALGAAAAGTELPVRSCEPEVYVRALGQHTAAVSADETYLAEEPGTDPATLWADSPNATWGIQAVHAAPPAGSRAPWAGSGITVAVLDTGVDLGHPDLAGVVVAHQSFVDGEEVHDRLGHGTHVAGTIAGAHTPPGGQRRFSVAPSARLAVGKVLSNEGSGSSGGVLAGINWAVSLGAPVISMSLGSAVAKGETYLQYYEAAAQAALDAGCLIVAAAGNEGYMPVGSPANCPSVMAVAALDRALLRASFSCVALNGDGGEVNIAAPGVDVYSSYPVARGSYAYLSGTSMATPHVSGVAAVYARATGLRGRELWARVVETARGTGQDAMLVGAGCATVPTRPPA